MIGACTKHKRYLIHGIKRGYPVMWFKAGYLISKDKEFLHCPECLEEIKLDIYGKPLFN